ncbi:hypothetical protein HOG75_03030 [bacterium]|nr:hypothetical protein [bacterium]
MALCLQFLYFPHHPNIDVTDTVETISFACTAITTSSTSIAPIHELNQPITYSINNLITNKKYSDINNLQRKLIL